MVVVIPWKLGAHCPHGNYRVLDSKAVKSVKENLKKAPGPRSVLPLGMFWSIRRQGFGSFLEKLAREYGDVAHFKVGPQNFYLVSHPDEIREILVNESDKFNKGPAMRHAKV